MATVVHPESGRVTPSFAAVAKHYGVSARPCPPRRGNRKGVVEKANHVAAQRFWRTLADDVTPGRPSNSSTLVRPARGRAAARDRRRQGHRRRSRRPRAAAPRAARSQGMTMQAWAIRVLEQAAKANARCSAADPNGSHQPLPGQVVDECGDVAQGRARREPGGCDEPGGDGRGDIDQTGILHGEQLAGGISDERRRCGLAGVPVR